MRREIIGGDHYNAQRTIQELERIYHGDPHVQIRVVDNSRGPNQARVSSVDELRRSEYRSLEEVQQRVRKTIEDERERRGAAGEPIPDNIYRGLVRDQP